MITDNASLEKLRGLEQVRVLRVEDEREALRGEPHDNPRWNPVGEQLFYGPTKETLTIIGVMKDFNFESFKEQVRPLSLRLTKSDNTLLVRYTGNAKNIIDKTTSRNQIATCRIEYVDLYIQSSVLSSN